MKTKAASRSPSATRRDFLKTSAALVGTAALGRLSIEQSAHAAGNGAIRIGLIGCGGRGTGAAINAMNAGRDVRLAGLADIFDERLQSSRAQLEKAKPDQVELKDAHCFVGFDAWQKLIASDVDVVLIAAASHFHPPMLKAAIEAGKHVFCEKPHGIDIPGVKISMAAAEQAKAKGLSLVSGLCWRYDPGVRETMSRIHDGAIGDIVAIQENYLSSPYIVRERRPGQGEMEYQMWNWYHFNWLSGDQTAQQLIHSIDKSSWALRDQPPRRVYGMGGRQTALDPQYGDQFDHHAVVFEYDNGVRVFGFTRDQTDCHRDTNDYIFGTKGRCNLLAGRIEGETNWQYGPRRENMYDLEHKALFDAIRAGRPIHNGHYMCLSSALAIAAQIACYTGAILTWEDVWKSKRSFALPRYGWDVEPPVKPGPDGRYPAPLQGSAEYEKWLI
ncbi:MAG TPA: Gfo/Idh/MocA family oxidoreductase [Candidatus Paceibacterota bacterium]|nr:Gfo/Idh/MocA family oxidoreductase [Verrucomicrobiota bacterium]HOX02120.1 Gfo/Idh/MocA family oxidoreductase [Verrucomicrobiota bacterium]HRZ44938.1 Gfo/Idh/MocA family oxidoreductase [Candidatus Paceibacterota bacterium]